MLSVITKHVNLVHNPCTHERVAHRIANDRRVIIQFIIRLKSLFYLTLKNLLKRLMRKSISLPINQSTEIGGKLDLDHDKLEDISVLSISVVFSISYGAI